MPRPLLLLALLLGLSAPSRAANINDDYTDQGRLAEVEGYTTVSPTDLTILRKVTAKFPRRADDSQVHVECLAQLFVSEKGKVEDVRVLAGCPDSFHRSVKKAARKWRFEPYTGKDGAAAPVTFALRFRFQRPG